MFRLFLVVFVLAAGAGGSMYALEKSASDYRNKTPVEQIVYGTRTGPTGQPMLVTVR